MRKVINRGKKVTQKLKRGKEINIAKNEGPKGVGVVGPAPPHIGPVETPAFDLMNDMGLKNLSEEAKVHRPVLVKAPKANGKAAKTVNHPDFVNPKPEEPKIIRWWHKGPESLNDPSLLPPGWTHMEHDLDPQDLDAQIKRCEERIEDNMMTYIFIERLRILKEEKAQKEEEMAPYKHLMDKLSIDSIKRIIVLEQIRDLMIKKPQNERFGQLENLDALLYAYKSGKLVWGSGITYWSHGKMVGEAKEFKVDEFRDLNQKHKGYSGFWVERPTRDLRRFNFLKNTVKIDQAPERGPPYRYIFELRLGPQLGDGSQSGTGIYQTTVPELEFQIMDDTGADDMFIYRNDILDLKGWMPGVPYTDRWPWEQLMGLNITMDANQNRAIAPEFLLEVNFFDLPKYHPQRRSLFQEWIPIPVTVDMEHDWTSTNGAERLSGHILRRMLYVGTAPEGRDERSFYVSTHIDNLTKDMPEIQPQTAQEYEAAWSLADDVEHSNRQGAGWAQSKSAKRPDAKQIVLLKNAKVRYPGGPGAGIPVHKAQWDQRTQQYLEMMQ